ncbi:phosphotransferase [Streptomyces sp. NBC_00133]|uniref:phosphotransferase family protein n=1 Tax=Streptomyces sp. NBC_00133 TaxID=2903624 RepID=UPI00324B59E9
MVASDRPAALGVTQRREVTLVHGDFHVRNVITSYGSGEVTAVLDWELSTLGGNRPGPGGTEVLARAGPVEGGRDW